MDRAYEASELLAVMHEAKRYNAWLTKMFATELKGCARVLDFGAGDGGLAGRLAERGFEVVGLEPDPTLRAAVEERGLQAVASLPEGEPQFDAVYSSNVLEHIEDDVDMLRQLAKQLRPGGRIVIYVPAFEVLFSANDERVGHFRRYTRKSLGAACEAAGLKVVRSEYVDAIGFVAGLAYRFQNSDGGLNKRAVRIYDRVVFPISRVLDRVLHPFVGKNVLVIAEPR